MACTWCLRTIIGAVRLHHKHRLGQGNAPTGALNRKHPWVQKSVLHHFVKITKSSGKHAFKYQIIYNPNATCTDLVYQQIEHKTTKT